ncbi:amino acid adenylation domain-containing protein [Actinokineospora baliensis]|uniref:non-ribosomal peptide synthetase n=1 Tax=Actinokineospora baliensis TaxID=547056 RepID=UPI001956E743|nr:non-ribosomal peptide synthetase [Actinokineospora baliensis]MBM7775495.1 amino acid adenylation domain-containing protein [Actinokineospora baliensis]
MEPATLCAVFAEQVRRHPDRVAVTAGSRSLTYAELDRLATGVARWLVARGVRPGARVGVRVDRSTALVVAVLGVLRAGAGYVPVDVRTVAARADLVFADSGCAVVLADDVGARDLAVTCPVVDLDEVLVADPPAPVALPEVRPGDLAHVIYTSGSTGAPKGVMVDHSSVVRLFAAAGLGASEQDVWTLFHSPAFDFSVWEIWGALLHGGRLVVVPHAVSRSPARFAGLILDQGVTVVSQTPTAFRSLHAELAALRYPPLPCRLVVFGGEALDVRPLAPWFDAYGEAAPRLVNMYGITETTVHVTHHHVRRADVEAAVEGSPIGRPLSDLRAHPVTADLEPVADGAAGELVVGGAGVAWGYLNQPGLTALRFLPDPWGPPGSRVYRSGDRAAYCGGDLRYLGRGDRQVKVRGFRVEPGEIEHALRTRAGVLDAAVIVQDGPSGPRLVAYVVQGDQDWDGGELIRQRLAAVLPDYLVPAVYQAIPAIPRTINGKLDESALPRPARPPADPVHAEVGGSGTQGTLVERVLTRVWRRRLGLAEIDRDRSFFALGGDSIIALGVVADARELGVSIRVEDLLTRPTLRDLIGLATTTGSPAAARIEPFALVTRADRSALTELDLADAYPASNLQQGMIYLCELSDDPSLYHDLMGVRVHAAFDASAMERALAEVTAQHQVLRSRFDLGGFSQPLQLVEAGVEPVLLVESAGAGEDPSGPIQRWRDRELGAAIAYDRAPMWNCHVLTEPDGPFHLTLAVHHALVDGWSLARLMVDLLGCYDRALTGRPVRLPVPTAQPQEFVAAERAALESATAAAFWREQADVPPVLFDPGSWPKVVMTDRSVDFAIEAAELTRLRDAAAAAGVSLKSVVLACHVWALARCADRVEDVVTGVVVNGRPDGHGADRLVGLFLNTVPLRVPTVVDGWGELARACHAAEQALVPHRFYPLSEIERALGRPPFDVSFNFTHFHVMAEADDLAAVRAVDGVWYADKTTRRVLVEVIIDAPGGRAVVTVRFDRSVPDTLAHRLVDGLTEAVRSVAAGERGLDPLARLGETGPRR